MNRLMCLCALFAAMASGAACAQDAGLCKPICAQEKRACRAEAVNLIDHETESLNAWKEKNPAAREFGAGAVRTGQPVGAAANSAKDRKMTRLGVCEDKYQTCASACPRVSPASPEKS